MSNWFDDFEGRTQVAKDQIPWLITIEYEIQSNYFSSELKSLVDPETASKSELLSMAQHCNNLIAWIEQMRIMGYTSLPSVFEDLFQIEFGSRNYLVELRGKYTEKWLQGVSGQQTVGENSFTIHEAKPYYSTIRNVWYEADPSSIFDIMPVLLRTADELACVVLNRNYNLTRYQQLYLNWSEADYSSSLTPVFMAHKTGQTTPENVLEDTLEKIEGLIQGPIALGVIEEMTSDRPDYLEYLIKICCLVTDFAQRRRSSGEHSLYLLRDCAMFHEAQIILDILTEKPTSHDQIYLGRQSLSSKERDAGHWYVAQELLLNSLQKFPDDYAAFAAEFTKSMREYEEHSPAFAELVQEIARYLNNHIEEARQHDRTIRVIDLGFQGSINMLVKYILDRYCLQDTTIQSKIHMYVVAEWFKNVYPKMYSSDTFSSLTSIEVMARNNEIYEYELRSLRDGALRVNYGNVRNQDQANLELIVLTMTILLAN